MNRATGVSPGIRLRSPAGRLLEVSDVFVPRNNPDKITLVSTLFRNSSRNVVVFKNGSMTTLSDVRARYQLVATAP